MVYVPSARKYGFALRLHEDVMRGVLNSAEVEQVVSHERRNAQGAIESHVRATASPVDAESYVAALFSEEATSDLFGFDFKGEYGLGNRTIGVIGIARGASDNPDAKPPFMVESETHSLTSAPGFMAGKPGEDIR